jgi:predicted lactoylglutathione lyase
MATIYINLPVKDLSKATDFYEAIGFIRQSAFSNEVASALCFDETLYVMLLTHEFAKTFIPHKTIADSHTTCEVLNAIKFNHKIIVDAMFDKAIAAGGKEVRSAEDHGFMYSRDFEDLDGHIWEVFWMQPQGS